MGKYVNRITHKGKGMLFVNTRGLNEKEGIEALEELRQAIPKNPDIRLTLVDGTDGPMSSATVRKAKEALQALSGEGCSDRRNAFVGLNPIAKSTGELVARGMRLNMHFCATLEEGKEWLVKEDDKHRKG